MENEMPATPIDQEQNDKKLVRNIKIKDSYQLKFLLSNDEFYIQCIDENIPYFIYENVFNLNKLVSIHKYFLMFDDIKEISSFFVKIDERLLKLEKNNKIINIVIPCTYKEKLIDINISLPQSKKLDVNEMIMDLYTKIKHIQDENKVIKLYNENLKNENENIKNEIQLIKKENENLKNEMQIIKNEFQKEKNNIEKTKNKEIQKIRQENKKEIFTCNTLHNGIKCNYCGKKYNRF